MLTITLDYHMYGVIMDEEKEIFSGTVYHCGGIDSGNLGGDIKSFANDVKNLIPKNGLSRLLETSG